MKKLLIAVFPIAVFALWSCEKEKATADIPMACFTVTGVDSTKVAGMSTRAIDSIIKFRVKDYFINVSEGVATGVYRKILFFDNCGGQSNFRVIYTGDPTRIYIADPANPGGVTAAQSGANFTTDTLSYLYPAAGTYKIAVVSSNVADKGNDIRRAVAEKTIILK